MIRGHSEQTGSQRRFPSRCAHGRVRPSDLLVATRRPNRAGRDFHNRALHFDGKRLQQVDPALPLALALSAKTI